MLKLVISTPDNTDRLKNVHVEMTLQGMTTGDYELVPAEMIAKHPPMGISRSFKKCIRIARERGEKVVNIFEDDMYFLTPDAYNQYLEVFQSEVPKNEYDIYLGGIYDGNVIPVTERLAKVLGKLSGLHCAIIPEHFYDTILTADENLNLDYFISQTLKARIFVMYPMGVIQKDAYSYNARQVTKYNSYLHTRYKILTKKEL